MLKKKTLARKPWTKEDLRFECKNARGQGREGDETDPWGGTAEGNNDRHRSPTLTTS
jgi:hypothetical protein